MLQFVIWGCGYRGKMLLKCVDKDRISAFIDNDVRLQGSQYCGIPIISFREYLDNYKDRFIIVSPCVSPKLSTSIVDSLVKSNIYNFFILKRSPGELPYYESALPFDEMLFGIGGLNKNEKVLIAGLNLFAIMLYEHLKRQGYEVYLYDCELQAKTVSAVKKDIDYLFLQHQDFKKRGYQILITDRFLDRNKGLSQYFNNSIKFYRFPWLKRYDIYKKLQKFKNIHDGKRCFLVATGPSLKVEDLDRLHEQNELTISVNMIYRCFDKTDWRPDYLVCTDTSALDLYIEEFKYVDVKNKFFSDRQFNKWKHVHRDDCFLFHSYYEYYEEEGVDFSSDICKGVFAGCSVVYSAIQIIAYMGVKEIYIIGADCEYINDGVSIGDHFIEDYYGEKDVAPGELDTINLFMDYEEARKYAERHGIKIYNATRGGKLEVFDRVNFDSLF